MKWYPNSVDGVEEREGKKFSGPPANIYQTFRWKEPLPCGRKKREML